MYCPTSKNEWLFCGALFTQGLVVTLLEIFLLIEWLFWVNPNITQVQISYTIPIGMGILIFACVYEALLSLDAIHHRNNISLAAICFSNMFVLVYASIQYLETQTVVTGVRYEYDGVRRRLVDSVKDMWKIMQPAALIIPIVIGMCSIAMVLGAYRLQREYTWLIYKAINGSPTLRLRYLAYECYLVLAKYVFFFLVAFIVEYSLVDVHFDEPEYSLTMALIPASFMALALGIYCVKKELKWAMVFIIICFIGLLVYLLSRVVVLCGTSQRAHTASKDVMLLFASITLALTVLTVGTAILCVINFDHGVASINPRQSRTSVVSQRAFNVQDPAYTNQGSDLQQNGRFPIA
ncbi:hypothetical protein ETB97_003815 [Aspergillus alliaceus]|uniref:Uncharacterized protein n=1 Tax=Petromyces alliaceus TaxID=209559 RepID=A0A8H5ZYR0_PETAA|nr:hypothetical protein ETB97_003815 [Aspergillus burnettii]